jgi:hypothetical protein
MRRPPHPFHLLAYLVSLPERVVRAVAALLGVVGHALTRLLPRPVREAKIYRLVVERNLKTLADDVGQAGLFPAAQALDAATAKRLAVGGVADNLMMIGLHASPLWVLLAATDVSNGARAFVGHLAQELKRAGVMKEGAALDGVDGVLAGLSRLSDRLSDSVDMPPLSLAEMRATVSGLGSEMRHLAGAASDVARIDDLAAEVVRTAAEAQQSLLATTGNLAVSTLRGAGTVLKGGVVGAGAAASWVGNLVVKDVLGDYLDSLRAIRRHGFYGSLGLLWRPSWRSWARVFAYRFLTLTETGLSFGRWRGAPWRLPARGPG